MVCYSVQQPQGLCFDVLHYSGLLRISFRSWINPLPLCDAFTTLLQLNVRANAISGKLWLHFWEVNSQWYCSILNPSKLINSKYYSFRLTVSYILECLPQFAMYNFFVIINLITTFHYLKIDLTFILTCSQTMFLISHVHI